jgi:superfamily II DNA/RNA helicase
LRRLIRAADGLKNAIIFCNRKREVALLHRSLVTHGFSAVALHGDMDQSARTAALDQFRRGEVSLLVASDVAARGLDIPDVSHVFNFDVPHHPDDYVHRIGRTGRAGRSGTAVTIVAPIDQRSVTAIEKLIGQSIAWAGAPPAAADHEDARQESHQESHQESRHGGRRTGRGGKPRPERSHAERPHRERQGSRERQPASVASLDSARPRPAPAREPADDAAESHLPAFLFRPTRLKA